MLGSINLRAKRTYWHHAVNIGLGIALSLLIAGCSTVTQQDPQFVSEKFRFIGDGKTSREEIVSRLGEPVNRYEGGRILTYVLYENRKAKGQLHLENLCAAGVGPCAISGTYDLVLVFGSDGLLERHSLVLVK